MKKYSIWCLLSFIVVTVSLFFYLVWAGIQIWEIFSYNYNKIYVKHNQHKAFYLSCETDDTQKYTEHCINVRSTKDRYFPTFRDSIYESVSTETFSTVVNPVYDFIYTSTGYIFIGSLIVLGVFCILHSIIYFISDMTGKRMLHSIQKQDYITNGSLYNHKQLE